MTVRVCTEFSQKFEIQKTLIKISFIVFIHITPLPLKKIQIQKCPIVLKITSRLESFRCPRLVLAIKRSQNYKENTKFNS